MHGEKEIAQKMQQSGLCRSELQKKSYKKWGLNPENLAVPIDKKTIIWYNIHNK